MEDTVKIPIYNTKSKARCGGTHLPTLVTLS